MADLQTVAKLRSLTGAGIVDCQKSLAEAGDDLEKAVEILRKKGEAKAAKKIAERESKEGIVYAYIHANNTTGAMLELFCESDFVARTPDFKALAHDLAMQIVAMSPEYLSEAQVPAAVIEKEKEVYMEQLKNEGKPVEMIEKILPGKISKFYEDICLLNQTFIKDETKKISDLLTEAIAKTGEKIEIGKFARFQM
jgi:elongation factor Ts